jgi:8-oxo-dGTP pyrophosphatase MutT (NUDIX family)
MLVDDRPDLQVLLVRRTMNVVFGPDNWVFPGGRVDPGDHLDAFDRLFVGLSDREASRRLGVDRGGLAWWLAACRETLEEAGLLLATNADPALDLAALRDRVRSDTAFATLLLEHRITLDASVIEEVARFITPAGPPRRFDARFFVARAPGGQHPHHDNGEIVNLAWFRPGDAVELWRRGEMAMMSPTVRMLACLTRFGSAAEVLAAAQRRRPYQQVRVADPEGAYEILLPGEPGYATAAADVESGWVRLWEPPGGAGDPVAPAASWR